MHRIFVYGTLKEGNGNARLMPDGTIHRPALTSPGYALYGDGIPFMVKEEEGEDQVRGEVVEVDDETLDAMDRLEGHPRWYRRTPILVFIDGEEEKGLQEVEAYLIPSVPSYYVRMRGPIAEW